MLIDKYPDLKGDLRLEEVLGYERLELDIWSVTCIRDLIT